MKGNAKGSPVFLILFAIFLLLTAHSEAQQFGFGIGIHGVQVNQSQKEQVDAPSFNFVGVNTTSNITINVPMSYNGSGLKNITIQRNSFGFKNPLNITINESGTLKNATVAGNEVIWEANLSAGSATIIFDVVPPTLSFENITRLNSTFLEKNFTISADESFTNVSVTMEVNESYEFWTLYFLVSGVYEDKTTELNLQVSGTTATFYGFNTSEQLFSLVGSTSCTESWTCTGWSDSANSCGTRTCTDSSHCGTTDNKPSESASCPSAAAPASSGGGGGGGGGAFTTITPVTDFHLSEDLIRMALRGDGIAKKTIIITNTGTKTLSLLIDFSRVADFVITPGGVSELEMDIAAGEEKSFDIIVFGSGLKESGVYSGNIVVSGGGVEKRANIVLEYESEEPLFDVEIKIPQRHSKVFPGEGVFAEIRLFNLKGTGKVDVKVSYSIKDSEGATIAAGLTTAAVETQMSFVRELTLPEDVELGRYVFTVEAISNGVIGLGSDVFEVVERPIESVFAIPNIILFTTAVLMIMFAALIALSVLDLLQHHGILREKAARKARVEELSGEELEKKLKVLEESFESGMISARAYISDKTKIERMLKDMKKKKV